MVNLLFCRKFLQESVEVAARLRTTADKGNRLRKSFRPKYFAAATALNAAVRISVIQAPSMTATGYVRRSNKVIVDPIVSIP